jgi:hypothetical protein
MQHNANQYRARRWTVMLAITAGITILVTACGSGTTTTDTAAGGASPASTGASSPSSTGASSSSQSARYAKALAYSQCIRSHGVPDFPDPTIVNGSIGLQVGNLKESQSTVQAAQNACQSLSPVHPLSGAAEAKNVAEGLKWAQCIRQHGVPNFPDPSSSGVFALPSGLNPQSASLQAAMNACQSERPQQIQMSSGNPGPSS